MKKTLKGLAALGSLTLLTACSIRVEAVYGPPPDDVNLPAEPAETEEPAESFDPTENQNEDVYGPPPFEEEAENEEAE